MNSTTHLGASWHMLVSAVSSATKDAKVALSSHVELTQLVQLQAISQLTGAVCTRAPLAILATASCHVKSTDEAFSALQTKQSCTRQAPMLHQDLASVTHRLRGLVAESGYFTHVYQSQRDCFIWAPVVITSVITDPTLTMNLTTCLSRGQSKSHASHTFPSNPSTWDSVRCRVLCLDVT